MPKAAPRDSYQQHGGLSAWMLAAAAGVGLALGACQSTSKPAAGGTKAAASGGGLKINEAAPFAGLKALSEQQRQTPDAKALAISPPPGIDTADVAPIGDSDANARMSVDAVLAKFQPEPASAPAEHAANQQAIRLYVSGKAKLEDGQPGKAVTDLEAATRLDPGAAEPWCELGEAQLALGRRTSAIASYQKAVKLGLDDPRLLVLLAREAMKGRHYDDAAKLLVQAQKSPSAKDEPGLAVLANTDLAEAVAALGYLGASRDLLARGLQGSFEGLGQSRLRSELAEVVRRRGELWQRVGDISCRLGQYDKAAEAYANAAQVPTLDPGSVISRRVYAYLKLGRSADAALVVIEDIRQSLGRVEDRHMGVIRFLAQGTEAGPKMGEAIGDLSRMVGPEGTPTVLNRLARASAAALSGEQARGVLRARLAKSPEDPDLTCDLLRTRGADDYRGTIADCTKLIQASPLAADSYAQMIIVRGQSVEAIVQALSKDRAPAARLLGAALLTKLARPDQALARLEGDWPAELLAPALMEQTQAAVAGGDWTKAAAFESQLATLKGPESARAHARALESMQQFDQALQALEPVAESADAQVEDRLLAADLALRADKPLVAEEYLQAAVAADRFDERAHEALLSLYGPGGPLADDTKLTNAARALRQSVASSRAIRGLSAQDLVSRSLWAQAQRELMTLLTDGNENPGVMKLLVTVWERAAQSDPELTAGGERWLRAELAERPESSAMLITLAHVLVAENKASEADSMLVARMQASPLPELARTREWVVRDGLERPDEADQMARLRLERAPKNIDNTIELAEILVKAGDVDEAAKRLTSGLPEHVKLTSEQAARLVAVLPKIKPETLAKRDPASLDVAIRLFDLIAGRGSMTPQMHATRLTLLASGHPDETDRLIAAVDEMLSKNPQLYAQAYDAVIQALSKLEKPKPMLAFLAAASLHAKPPLDQLYLLWFGQTCAKGDEADLEKLVNGPKDNEQCAAMLHAWLARPGAGAEDDLPETLSERRADIARYAGDLMTNLGRDELAEKAYRLALKVHPDHAWAANNLGYALLESGRDIPEATRLIEVAYKELNEEYQVIDSMGWLRYKQGKISDTRDEANVVMEQGALSLLKQALEDMQELAALNPDRKDATIMDHAADAYWRSGDKDKAKELWLSAEGVLNDEMRAATRNQASDVVKKRVQTQLQSVKAKRTAAERNQEPPVAPFAKQDAKPAVPQRP
jgi:tetratricopeptide (TPR) repeat protein